MNMNNTENNSSLPPVNQSQVEDFDLVILKAVPDQRSPRGPLREKVNASRWLSAGKNIIQIGD